MLEKVVREERAVERLVFYLKQVGHTFVALEAIGSLTPSYRGYPLERVMAASPIPAMLDKEKAVEVLRDWDKVVDRWRLHDELYGSREKA